MEHMAKHGPISEVSSAAAVHSTWTFRGRVVAPSSGLLPGALPALVLLLLPL